jgi:WD40 repeat protein
MFPAWKQVASGSQQSAAVQNRKPRILTQVGHSGAVLSVAISGDGRFVVTGSNDSTALLWEAATGREIRRFNGHSAHVYSVAINGNGKYVVTSSIDGAVILWEAETGRKIRSFDGRSLTGSSAVISNDGKYVLLGSVEGPAFLWDVMNQEAPRELRGFSGIPTSISDDGRLGLIADKSKTFRLVDVQAGKELRQYRSRSGEFVPAVMSSDGTTVVTIGQSESEALLWDVGSGRQIQKFRFDQKDSYEIGSLAISNNRKYVVAASYNRMQVWEAVSGHTLRKFDGDPVLGLKLGISSDGKSIVVGGASNLTRLFDVESGREAQRFDGYSEEVSHLAVSGDGRYLVTGNTQSKARVWGLETWRNPIHLGKHVSVKKTDLKTMDMPKIQIQEPSVSSTQDPAEYLKQLNEQLKKMAAQFQADADEQQCVAISKDGSHVVTAGSDGIARLWDVKSGNEINKFEGHSDGIVSVAMSDDDRYLVTGSEDKTARLWDLKTGKELKRFEEHSKPIFSVAISNDGRLLVTGGRDLTVQIWDTSTGSVIQSFKQSAPIFAMSKDGKYIVTWNVDGTMSVRDLKSGREIRRLGKPMEVINQAQKNSKQLSSQQMLDLTRFGLDASYTCFAISDNNRFLINGTEGGAVQVWDIESGRELRRFEGHSDKVNSIALVNNDRTLVTGSSDGSTCFWSLEIGKEMCRLLSFRDGSWVVVGADGHFDASNLEEIKGLGWAMPDDPTHSLPLEIFMRDYYEPRLLPRLLAGEAMKPVRDLQSLNRVQPRISEPKVSAPDAAGMVTVTLDVASQTGERQRDQSGKPLASGVYDVRLFRDGQLVGYTTTDDAVADATDEKALAAWRRANEVKLVNGKQTLSFRVALPRMMGKQSVEFSAYAFNADRVKSETVRAEYKLPTTFTAEPKRAYVVTFGVNLNDNAQWNLKYAANDARRMANELVAGLQSSREFAEVISIPLISDDEQVNGQTLRRREATRANLKAVIDLLAGRPAAVGNTLTSAQLNQLKKATPNDLVIFAFASHGYTDNNGVFYLAPQDTGQAKGSGLAGVLDRCISSDALSSWLRDVDAGEMVMIVDACHSAASVEGQGFKPGPMGSRGLGQLAYDKRIRILAATQADNIAVELNRLQHGLLTAALLEDGLKSLLADYKPKDGKIELGEWLNFGVERVPKLYDDVRAGRRAILENGKPVERSRSSEVVGETGDKPGRRSASIQQPSLFDFAHNHREIFLRREQGSR